MSKLIILVCVSTNEPTKEIKFKYYISNKEKLQEKIETIKNKIIKRNNKELKEKKLKEIYCDGYKTPNYKKYNRIMGNFLPYDDNDIFLIEGHSSFYWAYAIVIKNLEKDKELVLFEH